MAKLEDLAERLPDRDPAQRLIDEQNKLEEKRAKLSGDDLVKFDRAVEIAEQLKLLLMGVDLVIQNGVGSEELSGMVKEMRSNNDTLHAWPFPKTLNTAAKRDKELDVLDAIVALISAREAQREHKDPFIDDEQVAEMFGL